MCGPRMLAVTRSWRRAERCVGAVVHAKPDSSGIKGRKHRKCPSVEERMNTVWSTPTTDCYPLKGRKF